MRIAVNALWRATTPSGICRHAAALCRCLCLRSEVECVFLLIGSWQESYFTQVLQLSHSKLLIRTINIANRAYARNFWYWYGLAAAAHDMKADIVHLAFPAPLNRIRLRIPVVTTLHDLYPYEMPGNFGYPRVFGHRMLLRQCLRRSDRITCVSDSTLSSLAGRFGLDLRRKASRIHNCIDTSYIRERRPMLPNVEESPFLLCVAQHRRNKNIELLLNGYALLRSEGVVSAATGLLIVGSTGPETRKIAKQIARLELQDHVLLVSGITDAELAWLYKNALLTLCTSILEGFGLPVAEALQYGARVVCSDISAFREIGSDGCTFFSLSGPAPVRSFVEACGHALRRPAPTVSSSRLFSAEAIAAQCMDLYSDLLQSRLPQAA